MNALDMARSAYAPATPVTTPRATEYQAFARATRGLSALSDPAIGFPAIAAALAENRHLWTLLAADVADVANGLPDDLRARIFYLAEFTASHSRRVLKGEASADPLVEINTAVMRGLRMSGDAT